MQTFINFISVFKTRENKIRLNFNTSQLLNATSKKDSKSYQFII